MYKTTACLFIFIFICIHTSVVNAQKIPNSKIDSIEARLVLLQKQPPSMERDTAVILAMESLLSTQLRSKADTNAIIKNLQRLKKITDKTTWQTGRGLYNYLHGRYFFNTGQTLAAFHHYLEAESIFEKEHDVKRQIRMLFYICGVITSTTDSLSCIKYAEKGITLARQMNDKQQLAIMYNILGDYYIIRKAYKKAEPLFLGVDSLHLEGDFETINNANLAICYLNNNNEKKGLALMEKTLKTYPDTGQYNRYVHINARVEAVEYMLARNRGREAKKQIIIIHSLLEKYNDTSTVEMTKYILPQRLLKFQYLVEKELGHYQRALYYLEQLRNVEQGLDESSVKERTTGILSQLKLREQEQVLQKVQLDKLKANAIAAKKDAVNNILISAIICLAVMTFLVYRNYVDRKKITAQEQQLQQNKIIELENEKQLLAINAMQQGQEEERSRIAKDLHDGIGGMLSGTKHAFINLKENLSPQSENAALFDKSINMLDRTIADLRKVAHNLMPESLLRFGLTEALKDFCYNLSYEKVGPKIIFTHLGNERKLEPTAEIFVYRIVQELVNNAVKHAFAKNIFIQLSFFQEKVSLVVEDDGKGFIMNDTANSRGIGIENLKYRVQYLNGDIDIMTSPGNGTSVNIEIKA